MFALRKFRSNCHYWDTWLSTGPNSQHKHLLWLNCMCQLWLYDLHKWPEYVSRFGNTALDSHAALADWTLADPVAMETGFKWSPCIISLDTSEGNTKFWWNMTSLFYARCHNCNGPRNSQVTKCSFANHKRWCLRERIITLCLGEMPSRVFSKLTDGRNAMYFFFFWSWVISLFNFRLLRRNSEIW